MRIPDTEHTRRSWRIHDIAPDFRIEDVWSYRTPGARETDFPAMLDALRARGGLNENPAIVRLLFAARWKLGGLLGWDRPREGFAGRVETLCDRLPQDLRQAEAGQQVPHTPFTMVYELSDECALELANKTVHDILHLGWVPTEGDEYELHMAALVKPNGAFGRLYLAAIKPFRYLIVYPALTRKWERAWLNRGPRIDSDVESCADLGGDRSAVPGSRTPLIRPRRAEGRRSPLIKVAAGLLILGGVVHLAINLRDVAPRHARAWFNGDLWRSADVADMSPAEGAFWLTIGSWAMPQILLGCVLLWLDRHELALPRFLRVLLSVYAILLGLASPLATAYGAVIIALCELGDRRNRRSVPTSKISASTDALPFPRLRSAHESPLVEAKDVSDQKPPR